MGLFLLNKDIIIKKIRERNLQIDEGAVEGIMDAFMFYLRNIIDKLVKNSYIEFETEKFFESKINEKNEY